MSFPWFERGVKCGLQLGAFHGHFDTFVMSTSLEPAPFPPRRDWLQGHKRHYLVADSQFADASE